MKKILNVIAILLLCGCTTVGRKIDQAAVDQIKVGDSRESVKARIGAPDQVSKSTAMEMWTYFYARSTPKAQTFIPIAGAFVGGANMQNQMVMVTFDPEGKVKDVQSNYGGTEMNQGAGAGSKAAMDEVEKGKRAK